MRIIHSQFLKRWIDLDHILTIGNAYLEPVSAIHGWFVVSAKIQMMFVEKEILVTRTLKQEIEINFYPNKMMPLEGMKFACRNNKDGSITWETDCPEGTTLLAVFNLQNELDALAARWSSKT